MMYVPEPCDEDLTTKLEVGTRVWRNDGASRGTIRFVGPVPEIPANAIPRRHQPSNENFVVVEKKKADEDNSAVEAPQQQEEAPETPTQPEEHVWYGVEWDEPIGRNDGTVKGVRYFDCKPNHGSFIVRWKLLQPQYLCDLLEERYSPQVTKVQLKSVTGANVFERAPTAEGGNEQDASSQAPASPGHFVNVKNCDCCANLTLQSAGLIAPPTDPSALGRLFPNVTDLSMNRTLLNDWKNINMLLDQLPQLQSLSFSGNPLGHIPSDPAAQPLFEKMDPTTNQLAVYPTVKTLNVSSTGLSETDIWKLLRVMPNLEDLSCCYNRWTAPLHPPKKEGSEDVVSPLVLDGTQKKVYDNLVALRLDGNHLNAVDDVVVMFGHPSSTKPAEGAAGPSAEPQAARLKVLSLKGNPIKTLKVGHASQLAADKTTTPLLATPTNSSAPSAFTNENEADAPARHLGHPVAHVFTNVENLNLQETKLACWDELIGSMTGDVRHFPDAAESNDNDDENKKKEDLVHQPFLMSNVQELTLCETPLTEGLSDTERRRRLVGLLPKNIKKINRSFLVNQERVEAKKWMMLHFSAVVSGSAPKEPIPKLAQLLVEEQAEKDRQAGIAPEDPEAARAAIAALKPKLMINEFDVTVIPIFTSAGKPTTPGGIRPSIMELVQRRIANFDTEIADHQRGLNSGDAPKYIKNSTLKMDIRWDVQELEDAVAERMHFPMNRSEERNLEQSPDGWVQASASWAKALSERKHSRGQNVVLNDGVASIRDLRAISKFYGDEPTFALFHIDVELLESEGAVKKGMHIKNLVRPSDKLYMLRIQPNDFFVCVLIS